ncbi:MAG: polyprenyl diphosphate synthase [Clostridia bacterium]|nr:polyprenyl diphosphate synthase [Clostridia bacterium]
MENSKIIPSHVGIIMDGNGRWAQNLGKKRSYGHRFGAKNVERIANHAFNIGVKTLSLYAFSSENWARPKEEVDTLMSLLKRFFTVYLGKIMKNGIKLVVMGDTSVLADDVKEVIENAVSKSAANEKRVLNIAINYGGRQEIVRAANELIKKGEAITVESISSKLYTAPYGEPDLIIRTGGELRLSNFMLYQGAYSELYFTDVLWPDFNEEELEKAIEEFGKRNRRYGGI